jgi:hypothetical protein
VQPKGREVDVQSEALQRGGETKSWLEMAAAADLPGEKGAASEGGNTIFGFHWSVKVRRSIVMAGALRMLSREVANWQAAPKC